MKLRSTSSVEKNFAYEITWITWKTKENLEIWPFLNSLLKKWVWESLSRVHRNANTTIWVENDLEWVYHRPYPDFDECWRSATWHLKLGLKQHQSHEKSAAICTRIGKSRIRTSNLECAILTSLAHAHAMKHNINIYTQAWTHVWGTMILLVTSHESVWL